MRVAAAFLLLVLAAPLAGAAAVAETKVVPGKLSGQQPAHELNLQNLQPGEVLEYEWGTRTAGSLMFDVHYHDSKANQVRYLVDREQGVAKSGRVTVPAGEHNLSFLWENLGNANVEIHYEVKTAPPEEKNGTPLLPVAAVAALGLAAASRRMRR